MPLNFYKERLTLKFLKIFIGEEFVTSNGLHVIGRSEKHFMEVFVFSSKVMSFPCGVIKGAPNDTASIS